MRKMLFVLFAGTFLLGCKKDKDGTVTVVPLPPIDLTATVISTTQVNLSWTDKSTNETGFKIQRKTGSGNFADVGTVGKDVVTYSDNGLTPATTYTYRVYAYNSTGASLTYTNEVTVTTFGSAVLTTVAISNISNTSAKSGGTITSDGGSPITARGIVWSTSTNPTIALTTKTNDGTGTGSFTSNMTGLVQNTTYYVRAYATNSAGTSYGNEVSFKTLNVDITTGLVGFWPFNGNANDESGNGNNGIVNGATLTSDRFGNNNKAYFFDGVDDNINGTANNLPSGNSPRSLSVWVNVQQLPAPGTAFVLVNYGQLQSNEACGIGILNNSITFFSWLAPNDLTVSASITKNKWYNIIASFDGVNSKLFLDGVLITSSNQIKNTILKSLNIGFNSINQFTFGYIDDIRIYNRALTQQEITWLANN